MKFLKRKKYSILLNIFKYSFVGIFSLALILQTFFVSDFTKIAKAVGDPKITSFTPASGKVGDPVTITGENFIGVTEVYFNKAKAIPKESNSNSISVNVPTGATSGRITIKDTTSATDFEVLTNGTTTTPPPGNDTSTSSGNSDYNKIEFRGLVPVCNTGEVDPATGNYKNPCDFNMVMALVNKFINFLLFTIATPLFALIIIYVGWLYLSDMGSTENVKKSKKIFKNVVIGYVIALAAWLIVKTILAGVGFDPKKAFLEF